MTFRLHFQNFGLVVAGAVLLVGGCSWRSPTVQFFTMNALLEPSDQGTLAGDSPAVMVGPVALPRSLDRPQIVTRAGDNELVYDEYNRWAGSLEADFLSVVGDNLSALLNTKRVVVYPASPPFALSYRIGFDVMQFDGSPGGEVILRVRWTVSPGSGGESLAVEQSLIRQPTASAAHADLVAAHSAALATLSREVAATIAELEARAEK